MAFDEAIELDRPWTDFRGVKHDKMVGRPVSFHAMRGISAHSNGFQTCRALHIAANPPWLGRSPRRHAVQTTLPQARNGPSQSHTARSRPAPPSTARILGYTHGPEDLLLDDDGNPTRIDKAFSWENPMSAHGLMHMVISNAHAGDPYKIDTLFMYMANMSWNSSMNTGGVIRC